MKLRLIVMFATLIFRIPMVAQEPSANKQMDEILSELKQIRALLEAGRPLRIDAPQQMTRVAFDVKNAPVLGSRDAPVTIVEFMDYQCTFCRQFQSQTFANLKKLYIDTGKARFFVMDFPLDIHSQALLAAQAGRCSADQNRFWEMHNLMESDNELLDAKRLTALAEEAGIESGSFSDCLTSGKYKSAIQDGIREFTAKGVHATPTFIIGASTPTGVDGEEILGAIPLGTFQNKIDQIGH